MHSTSLPIPATLADCGLDVARGIDIGLTGDLATCRYLESATNMLLIRPPGVRRTVLSLGLACAAIEASYFTYFTTAAKLADRCYRATIEGPWATAMRLLAGTTLLVTDEFGYLSPPAEAASALV